MAYTQQDLLDAGVHFGHLTRKWNPKMAPYIFMEQNGIHIIDLNKTEAKLEEAKGAIRNIAKSGRKIMFVATKKQAKEIIAEHARKNNMPYVTERWLGGMLTNFQTVRRSIKRMQIIDRMATDGTFERINKKERLMLAREKEKLARMLGGIEDMSKLPGAIFIVDVKREHIAIAEAIRLGIPTFALVDTNSDPTIVDFAIPGNDDASKSIQIIVSEISDAISEGLQERRREKPEEESAPAAVENTTAEA
ncbi:MAG: 30S ribosomal protein S2 [Bacteroidetes bacterium]|nr:30S ribosomal protein S2 [Bacteroidota bacterium]